MESRLTFIERLLVRIVCVLALVMVGFGHKAPSLDSTWAAAEVAQYTLPDGNLPTLCVTVTDDEGGGSGKHESFKPTGCEACRLSASVLLPTPTDMVGTITRFIPAARQPQRDETSPPRLFPPNTGPRAPPSMMSIA
ncbi:hypothetical protein ABK249_03110 [Neorhizobium sp. Rsf11]|uniref:DUF2946 domain-containing protein n=1 Tax=Neorhizobium phenanthreniclasticum TaxID=3157917 RepID=A0ABV0LXE8_9HYPH